MPPAASDPPDDGDTIYAGSGDDTIVAGTADDILGGVLPQDTVIAGSGAISQIGKAPYTDVSIGSNQTISAGQSVTLTGTFVDPDADDTHTYAWTAADSSGQVVADGTNSSFTFTPPGAGTYTVTYVVADQNGGSGTASVQISATATPFAVTPPAIQQNAVEGQSTTFNLGQLEVAEPGPFSVSVQWGDGQSSSFSVSAGGPLSYAHTYSYEGGYTITETVSDGSGSSTTVVFPENSVAVTDQPVVATPVAVSAAVGVPTGNVLLATFTDPEGADPVSDYSASILVQDPAAATGTITFDPSTGVFSVYGDLTFGQAGSQVLTIRISHLDAQPTTIVTYATVGTATSSTVLAAPSSVVYGQTATWTATVSGYETPSGSVSFYFGPVNTADLVGTAALFATGGVDEAILNVSGLPASSGYAVTAVYNGDGSSQGSTSNTVTQVVTPASLSITANDQTMTYGGAMPALSVSLSGLVNGDSGATFFEGTNVAPLVTTVPATSNAGSYAINVSGALDPNYTITYVPGTLTINPAPLVITANNASKVYGAALPTFTASYSGFVNGDTAASLTIGPQLSTTATASSPAGSYTIAVSGAVDPNYAISYVAGTLTVISDALAFLSTSGDQYVVTPGSNNTSLEVTLGGLPVGTVAGGGTLSFSGSGGTITINGESGTGSRDVFDINDASVTYAGSDGLSGTTIDFLGTALTSNVVAQGTTNTFNIEGAGASGPSGSLVGDSLTNTFVFSGSSRLIGNIQGAGLSTLSYASYASGVTVKLGNGFNGTATGVSGAVSGITALFGSNYNDTLNAGSVAGVAITGGLGTNTLSGTGAGDSVVESIGSSYTLTSASLTGTGASGSFTDNLTGIRVASLTGDSAASNTFAVSAWTGSGSLAVPAGTGAVLATKKAGFTLSNTSLSSTDGMSLGLSGITTANLTDTGGGHTFTVSGWMGSGSITDTAGSKDTVIASKNAGFTLSNTSLSSTDGMLLALSGLATAKLTDSGSGGNTFNVAGWTGAATLKGTNETLVDSVSASLTLTNGSLAVTGGPTFALSGFTAADLTDTAGGQTFGVGSWTGSGSLTDDGPTGDAVKATKSAGFTLSNTSLSSTDGMSLALKNFTTANLTDGSGGGNTFNVTGWTGTGTLKGTAETIVDAAAGGFTLSKAQLTAGTMSLALTGFTTADLSDSSGGGNAFTVTGWTGAGTLSGSNETVVDSIAANVTLSNNSLVVPGGSNLALNGFTTASLTNTTGGRTFTVSGWTGSGSITDTAGSKDTVIASKNAGFTLSNTSLSSTDGMLLALSGLATAKLTDSGSGGNTFNVAGWTGAATLEGTNETLVDSVSASLTLTNASLAVTGGPTFALSGFAGADLTDTAGGQTFGVGSWTGSGSLTDDGPTGDTVKATKSTDSPCPTRRSPRLMACRWP